MSIPIMGRIKTKMVKRMTQRIYADKKDAFTNDYAKNKIAVKKYLIINSDKLENVIAGYVTKLVKMNKD